MAQTKRKRRTKHRGNAAGSIEARGRTGRKPTPQEVKAAARNQRRAKPPTWNSAVLKAGAMAILLFILTQIGIFGSETTASQGIFLAAMAMLIYTPLAYATDKFVYKRMQRAQQQKKH